MARRREGGWEVSGELVAPVGSYEGSPAGHLLAHPAPQTLVPGDHYNFPSSTIFHFPLLLSFPPLFSPLPPHKHTLYSTTPSPLHQHTALLSEEPNQHLVKALELRESGEEGEGDGEE